MARHKNYDWSLPDGILDSDGSKRHEYASIQCSLLMDIRDRLDRELRVLECSNTAKIPQLLRRIASSTSRRKVAVDTEASRRRSIRKARAWGRRH